MRTVLAPPLLSALLAGLLAACSGGSSGGGSGFAVVSCSLGCSGGGGSQIGCGLQAVHLNGELRFTFSQPVKLSSVNKFTFQVTDMGPGPSTGKAASGTYMLSSTDPRILIFRPQLTFDSSGNPVFGLQSGHTYEIRIPGKNQDPLGPYVLSAGGAPNQDRFVCQVEAALGILDPKPGDPTMQAFVDQKVYDVTCGTATGLNPDVLANEPGAAPLEDVSSDSQVTLVFDDLMNPATLVNPVTGLSTTIDVVVDGDGDVSDPSDQVPVLGTFTISLDQDALLTTVIFTPEAGFPSAGFLQAEKRKVLVRLSPAVADLGGNPLASASTVIFQPECFPFPSTELLEPFDDDANEDELESGGNWGLAGGLGPGTGGGSGRLGPLRLEAGTTLVLSTDSEDFADVPVEIFDPSQAVEPLVLPVVDGVFEFSSIDVGSGAVLRFTGSNPARVYARGRAVVRGRIDVAGEDAAPHVDSSAFGGPPTIPGPTGGAGGEGGRLPTWEGFETVAGTIVPPGVTAPADPDSPELDGQDGEGVPDNLVTPGGTAGAGEGGTHWPAPPSWHMPVDPDDTLGVFWDWIAQCRTFMLGGVGGGGGHGLPGGTGVNKKAQGAVGPVPIAPDAPGGPVTAAGLGVGSDPESPARTLDPEDGWLVGGAGGGGGGSHIAADPNEPTDTTMTTGQVGGPATGLWCTNPPLGGPASFKGYQQHSGPAGGAGGGAVQVQAGGELLLDGQIDASGGGGGAVLLPGGTIGGPNSRGSAGGGGAGGAILAQGRSLSLASFPGRFDISGGPGGIGDVGSFGGAGGAGLLRIETRPPLPDLAAVSPFVLPSAASLAALTPPALPVDVVSIGEFLPKTTGPGALSGSQSCWLRPEGHFFVLTFLEDDPVAGTLGWDMDVLLAGFAEPQSYRGPNDLVPGISIEDFLGTDIGTTPLYVRFQGARSIGEIVDLCDVELLGEESQILPGSLTGWVRHPAELNDFFGSASLTPNLVRFQIVFDRSQPEFSAILGVTELRIAVQPD